MSTLETFSQTGFQAALIQKQEDIDDYLDTAWTISALRGVLLFALLYLAAPLIARFFDTPAAAPIVRVISVSELLKGFTNVGVVYFQKELEFNKQFLYQLSGTMADLIVAVTAALLLRSVWALVFGLLARNAAGFAVSYIIHPYRPRMRLEVEKAKELYGFGRWVLSSSIVIFLITQGDDALVGKIIGATALGFYQLAYRFSNMPATEITHVVSQVTFPTYSKLQNNAAKLRKSYLEATQLTLLVSFPMAAGILVMAPQFTRIFLGEKWSPAIPAMQILAIFGAIRSFGATTGPLFQGVGKPQILTKISLFQLIILAAIVFPLTERWGILGTSVAVVVSNMIAQSLAAFWVIRLIGSQLFNFLRVLFLPAVGASIMAICVGFFVGLVPGSVPVFCGGIILGVTVYLGCMYTFSMFTSYGLEEIFERIMQVNDAKRSRDTI